MKTSSVFLGALLALGWTAGHGQDCQGFYPLKKGTAMEMTEYDGAKKMTGKVVTTIVDVQANGAGVDATLQSDYVDAKGKTGHTGTYVITCDGKSVFIDMQSMMHNMDQPKGKEDMDIKADGAFIEIPMNPKVGDQLKDGVMTMHMSSHGQEMGTMTMTIHRKIEARESVTVPAGTFECFRVAMEMENEMNMMGMKRPMGKNTTTEWFCPGTGPVKSETYSQGKLIRTSELTRITR